MIATISAIKRTTQKPREIGTPKLGPIVKHKRLTKMISRIIIFMAGQVSVGFVGSARLTNPTKPDRFYFRLVVGLASVPESVSVSLLALPLVQVSLSVPVSPSESVAELH